MVACTDLDRVPDSESTSALVSHIWPSSARTRCCSFCRRSRRPSRTTRWRGGGGQEWWFFFTTSSRHFRVFTFFNRRQRKTIKKSNFSAPLLWLALWQSFHKETLSKQRLFCSKGLFSFCCSAIISDGEMTTLKESAAEAFLVDGVCVRAALTGLLGTLWQVKSQTHRSSSASSSHEPPNVRQRSCSQPSAPDPEPPEPQSASKRPTGNTKRGAHN